MKKTITCAIQVLSERRAPVWNFTKNLLFVLWYAFLFFAPIVQFVSQQTPLSFFSMFALWGVAFGLFYLVDKTRQKRWGTGYFAAEEEPDLILYMQKGGCTHA